MTNKIDRRAYAEMFGPTVGDRVRLADTELWIEVEEDRTIPGEEVKFGGGKVIPDFPLKYSNKSGFLFWGIIDEPGTTLSER